jgi:predicted MFS family arabinose efflux permease
LFIAIDRASWENRDMGSAGASPPVLVALVAAGVFFVRTAALMLGPLLVALAAAFHTSVPVMGQLAAAINLSWGVTAPLVGPISDTYGRRVVGLSGLLLMALGMLGSILAWSYGALLACRLLTGVGAAMIPPNSMALIADHFPPDRRGTPISIVLCASFFGMVLVVPLIALLADLGGWRVPFAVMGLMIAVVWGLQWLGLPRRPREAVPALTFLARFRAVGQSRGIWYVWGANACYQMAAFGLFTYLAAFLIQTHGLTAGGTAMPLAVVGTGAMLGSLLGGRIASHAQRLALAATTLVAGGLLGGLAFAMPLPPWMTMLVGGASALLLTSFEAIPWALTAELAGESRATANGLLASSNQLGAAAGASMGGVVLALGGFPSVGLFCLGAATGAAVVIGLLVRSIGKVHVRVAQA